MDTDDTPRARCNPGSGELVQSGNLSVQIVGSPIDSEPRSDFAGWDIAICDLDNDGFDDLAIGAPNAAGGLGRVAVYYGPGEDWSQS